MEYVLELPHCKIPNVPLENEAISLEWNAEFSGPECLKEPNLSVISENQVGCFYDVDFKIIN